MNVDGRRLAPIGDELPEVPAAGRRLLLIANPISGNGRASEALPRVADRLRRRGLDVTTVVTRAASDGERLALEARADVIAVMGGDGTVNEVVRGILGRPPTAATERPPALAFIPFGTGNGTLRAFALPRRLDRVIDTIVSGREQVVDVGLVSRGSRRVGAFLLWLGVGIDGVFIHALASRRTGPMGARLLAWTPGLVRALAHYDFPALTVEIDGEAYGECAQVVVANVAATTVPRFDVAPDADASDGELDLVMMTHRSWLGWIVATGATLLGRLPSVSGVRIVRGSTIRIGVGRGAAPVQTDGEAAGFAPVDIRLRPRALHIIVP